jgi:predicted SprT family Zn-dependent metalloprotease
MAKPLQTPLARNLDHRIGELARLWSMPDLAASVSVRFSSRLTRSLGRADAATGRIALAALLAEDPALLDAALCHELAHLAAFRLVGTSEPPHGPTWQRLVRQAGHIPTLRLPISQGDAGSRLATEAARFVHSCPVCQFTRIAARRMASWRCADCAAAGLDGRLEITPVERRR